MSSYSSISSRRGRLSVQTSPTLLALLTAVVLAVSSEKLIEHSVLRKKAPGMIDTVTQSVIK
jgi:hypothetical protein